MNILDLFSGIGGFSLGLQRAGMKTLAFCEIDSFCQKVLNKNFPGVPVINDIKTITQDIINELGQIDLICGGFPCQPYSVAGKQRAEKDNRDLWPEMFRVIELAKPTWVIGENVANFKNLGFGRTKTNLESIGYTVLPFVIPACAVGAQHRRERIWIIAYLNKSNLRIESRGSCGPSGKSERIPRDDEQEESTSDLNRDGFSRETNAAKKEDAFRDWENNWRTKAAIDFGNWRGPEPRMGRAVYGLSSGMDKYRKQRVAALGNSIVPQMAEILGTLILKTEGIYEG